MSNVYEDTFYIYMDKKKKGEITDLEFDDKVKSGEINMKGDYFVPGMMFSHPKKELYWWYILPNAKIQRKVASGEKLTPEETAFLLKQCNNK